MKEFERRMDSQFLVDYNQLACSQVSAGKKIVLLFDTFEVVQEEEVGNWLLDAFLPESENTLAVVAGRKPVPERKEVTKRGKKT